MGLFVTWLKYTPANGGQVVLGPGAKPVRGEVRINRVLVAVRMFLSFAVVNKEAPSWVLGMIYGLADNRDLPLEAQSEDGGLFHRLRARHRVQELDSSVDRASVDRASDEEIVALFAACQSVWDRLIVLLLARAGLRRSDLHLLPDNRSMGLRHRRRGTFTLSTGRHRRLGEVPAHPQGAGGLPARAGDRPIPVGTPGLPGRDRE